MTTVYAAIFSVVYAGRLRASFGVRLRTWRVQALTAAAFAASSLLTACGGGPNTPVGSVVNSPGNPAPPPTKLVDVQLTVTIPPGGSRRGVRPNYVSSGTQSLVVQL